MKARVIIIILISCIGLWLQFGYKDDKPKAELKDTSPTAEKNRIPAEKLLGKWVRKNGGYVLEVSKILENNQVKAAYFNPQKKINVSKSDYSYEDKTLVLFVELNDAGYPGSYYKLKYFAEKDELYGSYFQATQKLTYEVNFAKSK